MVIDGHTGGQYKKRLTIILCKLATKILAKALANFEDEYILNKMVKKHKDLQRFKDHPPHELLLV